MDDAHLPWTAAQPIQTPDDWGEGGRTVVATVAVAVFSLLLSSSNSRAEAGEMLRADERCGVTHMIRLRRDVSFSAPVACSLAMNNRRPHDQRVETE